MGHTLHRVGDPVKMSGPFRAEASVTVGAKYGKFVHDGTRPHIIKPKNASVLFFEIGNRKVFAKEVHHPGTRARPFLREAIEQVTKNP